MSLPAGLFALGEAIQFVASISELAPRNMPAREPGVGVLTFAVDMPAEGEQPPTRPILLSLIHMARLDG